MTQANVQTPPQPQAAQVKKSQFVRPKTGRFVVLDGSHIQDDLRLHSDEQLIKFLEEADQVVKPETAKSRSRLEIELRKLQIRERIYRRGEIFESHKNWSRQSPEKYRRMPDDAKLSAGTPTRTAPQDDSIDDFAEEYEREDDLEDVDGQPSAITAPPVQPPNLEAMSAKELLQLCEDREIDVPGNLRGNKAELLKLLKR